MTFDDGYFWKFLCSYQHGSRLLLDMYLPPIPCNIFIIIWSPAPHGGPKVLWLPQLGVLHWLVVSVGLPVVLPEMWWGQGGAHSVAEVLQVVLVQHALVLWLRWAVALVVPVQWGGPSLPPSLGLAVPGRGPASCGAGLLWLLGQPAIGSSDTWWPRAGCGP